MLTQESFELLLTWLDPNREKAGERYERIHRGLIKYFAYHACSEPEQLADETIDRATAKINWLIENYVGEPEPYFYGIARNLHREYIRKKPLEELPTLVSEDISDDDSERDYECLDRCLEELPTDTRKTILRYHEQVKRAKINTRKVLAEELGISLNALRIRICRLHSQLQGCIEFCLEGPDPRR